MPEIVARFTYRAFISYSHRDRAWADWLHRSLETYRVPSRLVGKQTEAGTIPRRLNPVFRDREELSSSPELGSKINQALAQSENMIVLCSPAAAASRWVNEEVLAYKRMGRGARIFCLIVEGEPNATDLPGRAAEECFCPALRFQLGADGQPTSERTEPIAADARPGKDGKANAKLKLIAGMLDVGFDALKQREQQRRVRRMTAITVLAVCVMAVTSVLAVYALISRHTAVLAQHQAVVAKQAAVRRQKQAEGLVNFMLGDLNEKLQQVNRLDIMQSVDDKAMAYFKSLPTIDVNATALAQRAKALEEIGTVRLNSGSLAGALDAYRASTQISSQLAEENPTDVERQVAYSRTLAYIGMVHWSQGKLDAAQQDWKTARRVLQPSLQHAPNALPVLEQLTFLDNDIAHVLAARGQLDAAVDTAHEWLKLDEQLVAAKPNNTAYRTDLGGAHNELGRLALLRGDLATAVSEYRADDSIETRLSERNPKDNDQREHMLRVRAILGRTLAMAGDNQTGMRDLQQAVAMATEHSQADASNASSRELLALYSLQLARLERATGDLPAAGKLNTKAVAIFAALTKKDPSNDDWKMEYAEALTEQATELQVAANVKAARKSAQAALDTLEPMLAKHPGNRDTLLATVTAKLLAASLTEDPANSQALREQSLHAMQAVKANLDDPRLLALRVEALLGLGKKNEARNFVARLRASGYRDAAFVDELHRAYINYPVDAIAMQGQHTATSKAAGEGTSQH
jgi:tetratricopeptide (TPR) repeat protein